jgi:hypothetical protein
MNLIEMLSKQVGSESLGKLAGLLGEDPDKTKSAFGALLPTLLAGFAGTASSPEGARQLNDAVDQAPDEPDAGLAAMLGGGEPKGDPLGLLGDLLGGGGNVIEKLVSIVSGFIGIKDESVKKMLMLGVPLVLGFFKKQKQKHDLDAAGLSRMLASQKDQIAAAMPEGLGKRLAGTEGLGSLGSMARGLMGSAGDATRQAGDAARQAATAGGGAGSSMAKRIVPIAIIILLGLLAWKLFNRKPQENVAPPSETVMMLQDDLKSMFTATTEQVTRISDADSARAAVPELRKLAAQAGSLASGVNKLSAEARKTISETIKPLLATLRPALDRTMAIPGVSEVIQPIIGPMLETLEQLATA